MVVKALEDRIASVEIRVRMTGHVGVILPSDPADVPRLLDEAEAAGNIAPHHGGSCCPGMQRPLASGSMRRERQFLRVTARRVEPCLPLSRC